MSPYVNTTFQYNDEGIRTVKIANGVRHEYTVSGGQINREVVYSSNGQYVTQDLRYYYDAAGRPVAIRAFTRSSSTAAFTDATYYLLTNMQGDVVAIYNESGVRIFEYVYDAWGNILRSTQVATGGNAANNVNPFRYRGYYYDTETNLYYLQSRYYNPVWGRFLNIDSALYDSLLGFNLYAYCENNPIIYIDPHGESWDEFWDCVSYIGEKLIEEAVVVGALGLTALSIGGAVVLTGGTGGAGGAIAIPAAAAVAAKCLTVVVAVTATTGAIAVASAEIAQGPERGVGGLGWKGDANWRDSVDKVASGGDVTDIKGGPPTEQEAKDLIQAANGKYSATHRAHSNNGINTHLYDHVHYYTAKGKKATIKIRLFME